MYYFIDESGDLGFTRKSTKYFAVGFVCTDKYYDLDNKLKRLFKNIRYKKKLKKKTEFKDVYRMDFDSRYIYLGKIEKLDFRAGEAILKKEMVVNRLRDKKEILYNYIIVKTILDCHTQHFPNDKELNIVIDRRKSKIEIDKFQNYINLKIMPSSILAPSVLTNQILRDLKCKVKYSDSKKEACLQLAHIISNALYYKYELNDPSFYTIIDSKFIYYKDFW